jgi:hypothetical protein
MGDDTGSLQIGIGSRSSNHAGSASAYDYDRLAIGPIGVIANDRSRGRVGSRISSRTMKCCQHGATASGQTRKIRACPLHVRFTRSADEC